MWSKSLRLLLVGQGTREAAPGIIPRPAVEQGFGVHYAAINIRNPQNSVGKYLGPYTRRVECPRTRDLPPSRKSFLLGFLAKVSAKQKEGSAHSLYHCVAGISGLVF